MSLFPDLDHSISVARQVFTVEVLLVAGCLALAHATLSSFGGGTISGDTSGTGSMNPIPLVSSAHRHSFSTHGDRLAASDQNR